MKKSGLYILFAALIFCVSCEKVDVPSPDEVPVATEPVFTSDFNLGGKTLDFAAGKNNYLMEAFFAVDSSTKTLDLLGILRPSGCTSRPCLNSIRLGIRHSRIFDSSNFRIDDLLKRQTYEFASSFQRDSAEVRFMPVTPVSNGLIYTWKINDQREVRNVPQLTEKLKVNQNYTVTLRLMQQGCESAQIQTINLATGGCRCAIRRDGNKAIVRMSGVAPFKVQWSTGSQDTVVPLDRLLNSNMKNIGVKVVDARGCESSVTVGLAPGTAVDQFCETAFSMAVHPLPVRERLHLGKVFLEYTDGDGKSWRSNGLQQPAESIFELVEVSDFEKNDRNQRTKKINFRLNCLLSNPSKPEEELKISGKATMAVAYPD